jgi:hypothetical protein
MQELKQLQLDAIKKKPSYACSITLLMMHMFKTIVTTPRVDMYTRSLIRDLNYQAVINRFGFFCLQTQSNTTLKIPEIEDDPQDLIVFVLSSTGKKPKRIKPVDVDRRRTSEYPLGTHPTWQEITDTFLTSPNTLVSTRCGNNFWNGRLTDLQLVVIELMVKFSRQYWFTLDGDFLTHDHPEPNDWKDVMHVWSIEGIQEIVENPVFLPHKSYWSGLPRGPQQMSFRDRATVFFPPEDTTYAPTSIWNRFQHRGYIKDYHTYLTSTAHTDEDKADLQEGLKQAFDFLDCLPNRDAHVRSNPWRFDSETHGPAFLVNAKTYRIRGIGATSNKRQGARQKLMAPGLTIDTLLIADTEGIPVEEARKQIIKERYEVRKSKLNKRSGASKNKRKPPAGRKKKQAGQVEQPVARVESEAEEDSEEQESMEVYDLDDYGSIADDEEGDSDSV